MTNGTIEADARGVRQLTKMQKEVTETDAKDGTCFLRFPYADTYSAPFGADISSVLPDLAAARQVALGNAFRCKEAQAGCLASTFVPFTRRTFFRRSSSGLAV